MHQRVVELLSVLPTVQVIHFHTFQNTYSHLSGFVSGSIINLQAGTAAPNINAALAENHLVLAIDSLMTVPHNKKIIRASWNQCADQHECLTAHILGLIHDYGGQVRPQLGLVLNQFPSIPIGVISFFQIVAGKQMAIALENRPDLNPLLTIQTGTAANTGCLFVLIHTAD